VRIELEDVHHVYSPGTAFEVPALRGVSLTVEPQEILAVVGGTGSGKSTLVQHLNLLLKPTRGRVLVDGADVTGMKPSELRRRVGLVFQFPEAQLFEGSVREDVAFAPRQLGLSAGAVEERVREALEELDVLELAGRNPFSLSGGERRRVAIAGVLAMDPEVLVLDEPTAGLDPVARREMLEIVRRFRSGGRSVVLVSHDLDEVAEVADRVCVLERGRVAALGSAAEVFYANPELAPATVRVVAGLRRRGLEVGAPVRYAETLRALKGLLEG
jgi:energy-coupling factor transport system ATP-binding protein